MGIDARDEAKRSKLSWKGLLDSPNDALCVIASSPNQGAIDSFRDDLESSDCKRGSKSNILSVLQAWKMSFEGGVFGRKTVENERRPCPDERRVEHEGKPI